MRKIVKKRKKIIIVLSLVLIISGLAGVFIYKKYDDEKKEKIRLENIRKEEARTLNTIKENYNNYVVSKANSKLYELEENDYKEIGKIEDGVKLELENIDELTLDNKYFKLKNSNYYVYYNDVEKIEGFNIDDYYKNYVVFDNDVVTKNPTKFYDGDNLVYTIDTSFTLPIIINEDDYYQVEFDNKLLKIKKEDVEKLVENKKNIDIASDIAVLNYHFFYDKAKGDYCPEIICLDTSDFDAQLKYLKDNNFYTASMKDMALWMERKIQLPKKTAVITIDDGAMGTNTYLPWLLKKYDLHGTLFLITGWWPKANYLSDNLEIQSHGNNIHNYYGEALYKTKDELLDDFHKSIEALDGEDTALCYPFYAHNEKVRSAAKEAGFKIAFAGGNEKARQSDDPYQIGRYPIYSYTSLNEFIQIVN